MTLAGRWVLGALTGASFVSLAVAVGVALVASIDPSDATTWPPVAIGAGLYHLIWTGMLLAFYVAHLVARSELEPSAKAMWGLLFAIAAPFAMPVYWAIYILPGRAIRDHHWKVDPERIHVDEIPIGTGHAT